MATALHHLSDYDFDKVPDASNMCFGIVGLRRGVACFFASFLFGFLGSLIEGFLATLASLGDDGFALGDNIFIFVSVRFVALWRARLSFGNRRFNLSDSVLIADC